MNKEKLLKYLKYTALGCLATLQILCVLMVMSEAGFLGGIIVLLLAVGFDSIMAFSFLYILD